MTGCTGPAASCGINKYSGDCSGNHAVDPTKTCNDCPEFSTSGAGSHGIAQCTCDSGYYDSDDGPGVTCDVGFKNDVMDKEFAAHPFSVFIVFASSVCVLGCFYHWMRDFLCKATEDVDFLPGNGAKLTVFAHRGEDLPNVDTGTDMDPYCVISTGPDQEKITGHIQRTGVHVQGGSNPKWDHEMRFNLNNQDQFLQVHIWDADFFSKDDNVASTAISLKELSESPGMTFTEKEFDVVFEGKPAGRIVLTLTLGGDVGYLTKSFENPNSDTFDVEGDDDDDGDDDEDLLQGENPLTSGGVFGTD